MTWRYASMFAVYNRKHKTDLLGATDRQFALAEELNHVRHAVKRLAELTKNVATAVTYDLYVQNSTAASEPQNIIATLKPGRMHNAHLKLPLN